MSNKFQALKHGLRLRIWKFLKNSRALSPIRIDQTVSIEDQHQQVIDEKASKCFIENLRILLPAQRNISLGASEDEKKFLKISKYFNDGSFNRGSIFVCEIPEAYCHVGTGLICTRDFKAISDSQMDYRLDDCRQQLKWHRPFRVTHLPGAYASIHNVYSSYWWHWIVDCLPRIYSLQKAYTDKKINLLVPLEMGKSWHDSLVCLIPENFVVRTLPQNVWVSVDRMLFSSYVSSRANGNIPVEYVNFIRAKIFSNLNLPQKNKPNKRIYISRALTKHCRVINENELIEFLRRYGFQSVFLEKMEFKEQVKLFCDAEVIIAPYGSNWGNLIWAGNIQIFVLYPDRPPEPHTFTYAKALGQNHFFLAGFEKGPWSDFKVDLREVEAVLRQEMKLEPVIC